MPRHRSLSEPAPTMASLLRDRARTDGASELVRYAGGPGWSAQELWLATSATAQALTGTVGAGDVVVTAADTGPDAIVISAAVSALGAIELPLAPETVDTWVEHLVGATSPVAILATPERAASQRLLRDLATDRLPLITVEAAACARDGAGEFETIPRKRDDPALIMSTSGTTGRTKAALLPIGSPTRQAQRVAEAMDYGPTDVVLNVFGWHHINARNACFLPALISGARMVVAPRFSASGFFDVARREQVTAFNFMGALCGMLLAQPPRPTDRNHRIRAAYGGPAPADLVSTFRERFGVTLRQAYACTELADVAITSIDELRPGWAGRVLADYDVRVVDETMRPLPDGEVGELLVRPRSKGSAFLEYVADPATTEDAWYGEWFRTRDRAVLDRGWLSIRGRLGDVIRRRGTNIDPQLVEEALCSHSEVAEAAAVAVPSELTEDEILVVVVTTPGGDVTPEALHDHCRARLPRHMVPRFFSFESALPCNGSLKVDRAALRRRGLPLAAWDADTPIRTATEAP